MSVTNLEKGGPTLQVNPSARCNLFGAPGGAAAADAAELPRELIHAALKDAAHLGYEQLLVAGGEPFLYDGLPGVLARARRLDYVTTLVTNGMLIGQARRWAPVAPLIDFLAIPVHGSEAEHDAFVRREGAFAQTVANLAAPRGSGVPFGFILTVTAANAGSVDGVIRLAQAEGARSVELRLREPTGIGGDAVAEDALSGPAFAAIVARAEQVGRELGVLVRSGAVTQDELVLYRGRYVPRFPSRDITALAPVLVLESCGRVRPLTEVLPERLMLGSVHRHRLAALATAWITSGRAAELAGACERTWWELATPGAAPSAHWHDEVAHRLAHAELAEMLLAAA